MVLLFQLRSSGCTRDGNLKKAFFASLMPHMYSIYQWLIMLRSFGYLSFPSSSSACSVRIPVYFLRFVRSSYCAPRRYDLGPVVFFSSSSHDWLMLYSVVCIKHLGRNRLSSFPFLFSRNHFPSPLPPPPCLPAVRIKFGWLRALISSN